MVGAGPAGLAASACLAARSVDHVVLEKGRIANSWHTERWDSLTLLTPNWMRRLPGANYDGPDPDGFSTKDDTIAFLDRYAAGSVGPVRCGVTVEAVERTERGDFLVRCATEEVWECEAVIVAAGASSRLALPSLASAIDPAVEQIDALSYRNPGEVSENGEVLVVGAGASGVQLAYELAMAGRRVTIAVGGHVRLPRTYRGRDIHRWMADIGRLDEPWSLVDDLNRARHVPSPQLIGSVDRRDLDLNTLIEHSVRPVGKLMAVDDGRFWFSGSLPNLAAAADLKQNRLLAEIDEHILSHRIETPTGPSRPDPTRIREVPTSLDVGRFTTVLWATGYRPDWRWIDPRALDHKGRPRHDGGVGDVPGLYFLGLPYLRRRSSTFLDGIGRDAVEIVDVLAAGLRSRVAP